MRRVLSILIGGLALAALAAGLGWAVLGGAGTGAAEAAFEDWAEALRADGYEVAVDGVSGSRTGAVFNGLVIANPSEGWQWTAPQVRASGALDGDGLVLRVSGTQDLSYRIGGEDRAEQFSAEIFQITLEPGSERGSIGAIEAGIIRFRWERPEREPIGAGRAEIRLNLARGGGLVPDGSLVSIAIDDLLLPSYRRSAFGNTIKRLFAVVELQRGLRGLDPGAEIAAWQSAPRGMAKITSSSATWGLFSMDAKGILRLDDQYRPAGSLDVVVHDVLPALEAMTAAGQVDAQKANDFSFLLLEAMNARSPARIAMTMRIRDGSVDLREDQIGLPLINIGSVGPLLGMPPRR